MRERNSLFARLARSASSRAGLHFVLAYLAVGDVREMRAHRIRRAVGVEQRKLVEAEQAEFRVAINGSSKSGTRRGDHLEIVAR